jgi:hypothetical protein
MVELLQLVELLEMHRAHVVQVANISVATEQLRFREVLTRCKLQRGVFF